MKRISVIKLLVVLPFVISSCSGGPSPAKKGWASVYRSGTGRPVSVALTVYRTTLFADGGDLALARVAVTDSTGREIGNATTPFRIFVTGPASVVQTSDSSKLEYTSLGDTAYCWESNLVNGTFTFYLRAGTVADRVKLEVRSDSLWPASHEIHIIEPGFDMMKPASLTPEEPVSTEERMIGADISFLPQMEERGAKFIVNGVKTDPVEALAAHGINYVRLRIFVSPANEKGYSPGKGFCDLEHTKAMALRAKKAGMRLLLNFHYSDYWADPQQQYKPEAWKDLPYEDLKKEVYNYTMSVLLELKEQGTLPSMVQVGNEINHGMLWPDGHISDPDGLAGLLKAGVQAVRDVDPGIAVMMHIALGGQNEEARFWIDNMMGRGVDFDVLGLSYYPRWHGTLDDLQANLDDLTARYRKPVNVVEYSQYISEVNGIVFSMPDGMGSGTCNWEPLREMFGSDGNATETLFIYDKIASQYTSKGIR